MDLNTSDDKTLDSSTSETPDVATGVDQTTTVAAAASSDATGEDQPLDTLSIVRDVVGLKDAAGADQASPATGQDDGLTTDAKDEKKEPDDEDFSDVPFSKHPRFKQLIKQRNEFRRDATEYQNVQNFMDKNGIAAEEAAEGFVIMGLMRTDPAAAWERLKPHVQQLLVAAGEVLPDDLAQRVQRGEMPAEAAHEVSRSRAQVQSVQARQSFQEQQAERQRQTEMVGSLVNAATTWEADRRAKDPNFEAKMLPLQKELAFIQMREGKPTTPDGVLDQLKRAYTSVTPAPAPAVPTPQRRPIARNPMSGQFSGNAQPKPETTLDIIRANRGTGG